MHLQFLVMLASVSKTVSKDVLIIAHLDFTKITRKWNHIATRNVLRDICKFFIIFLWVLFIIIFNCFSNTSVFNKTHIGVRVGALENRDQLPKVITQ